MNTAQPPAHDRRAFLGLGGGAVLGDAVLGGGRLPRSSTHPDTVEAIVEAAAALAAEIALDDPRHDEAWTFAATALLARLRNVPPDPFVTPTPREQAFLDARGWTFRRVHAARVRADGPQVITHQLWIPPGGTIPLHDHRDLFGAIVCGAGEVTVRNFDIVDGGTDTPRVTLRESVCTHLRPGRYSLLTRARDNVHEFHAGKAGARLLDLFAWLTPQAHSVDLRWLDKTTATWKA
jgi:hypothetical protein